MRVTPESEPSTRSAIPEGVILAFDFGLRRLGMAVGESRTGITRPAGVIQVKDGVPEWTVLEKLVAEWAPALMLVGLPAEMDDRPTALTAPAKAFAAQLRERFDVRVELIDERLTSWEAAEQIREARRSGLRRRRLRKGDLDQTAAQIILESYLSETARQKR